MNNFSPEEAGDDISVGLLPDLWDTAGPSHVAQADDPLTPPIGSLFTAGGCNSGPDD